MAFVQRDDGAELYWEVSGDGLGVLVMGSYIQHPQVEAPLIAAIASSHRVIRYDIRGSGRSTRRGPYDREIDIADLLAVAETAGPIAVAVGNGDSSNRAVHAAARRPDLIPRVVSLETVPLPRGHAARTDALVGSSEVLDALIVMMRADYRSGLRAAIERGNPEMSEAEIRERLDLTAAYIDHDAACARLEDWINDDPGDAPAKLGDRLVIAYEGAGGWFPAELTQSTQEVLPEARFLKLDAGPLSSPELTAAVVRSVIAASSASPSPARVPRVDP